MERSKEIGDFLKIKRAKITPEQVVLASGVRRRTPGLRREEVAILAGVGLTWYTWLEQGRDIQVSVEVLASIARTLQLSGVETKHLFSLAKLVQPSLPQMQPMTISPMIQHVLDNFKTAPAMILDTHWNVIAWNKATTKLWFDYSAVPINERNILRLMFLHMDSMSFFDDWADTAQQMVAHFRGVYGEFVDDPWYDTFIANLRNDSPSFNKYWLQHDVIARDEKIKTLHNEMFGELQFEETSFILSDGSHLEMKVFTPITDEKTAEKIAQFLND